MEANRDGQTRKTTWLQRSGQITLFALRKQWGLTIGAAGVTGALVLLIVFFASATQRGDVWEWVQNVATCFTLGAALLIWLSERAREWRSDLPKRLTARFVFQREEVMVCEEAYLAGESDIRAWAQQLGFQMADKENLSLLPKLDQRELEIRYDENEKIYVAHYDVTVHLRELPAAIEAVRSTQPPPAVPVRWRRPDFFDNRYPTGAPTRPRKSDRVAP